MYNQQNNQLIEKNRFYLKKSLKSPVTLILGIAFAITFVFTLAYYLSYDMDFEHLVDSLSYHFRIGFFPCYDDSGEIYNSATELYLFCTLFVPLLSFVGYLLVFISSTKKDSTPKAGAVFLVVGAAISLFGTLCIQIMYMCSFKTYAEALDHNSDDVSSKFFQVTFIMVAYILYSISNLIFSCSISKMCKGQKRSGGGSVFFGISCILVAIGYICYAIEMSEYSEHFNDTETLYYATLLSSFTTYVLSAILAFIFRGRIMKNYTSANSVQPAAPEYSQSPYDYPAYQAPATAPNAPYMPPYQNTGYNDNFSPYDNPSSTANNAAYDTQQIPAPPTTAVAPAPTPVRNAEDGFTIDKDFVGDVPVFCPECGSPVKPQQPFCANCGKKLN